MAPWATTQYKQLLAALVVVTIERARYSTVVAYHEQFCDDLWLPLVPA